MKKATTERKQLAKKTVVSDDKEKLKEEVRKEIEEEKKAKFTKKKEKLILALDSGAMFFLTVTGILLAKYIPQFNSDEEIILKLPEWGRLVISFVLAMGVFTMSERKGSIQGKRKNFLRRAWFSIANGMSWMTILGF